MFYSVFLVMLGVYLGQEYNIPSVSLLLSNAMVYLRTQQIDNQEQARGYLSRIYEYFRW